MTPTRKAIAFFVSALLLLFGLTGCSAHKPINQAINFPDMHIEVDPTGNLPAKFWDSYSLFNQANRLFDDKEFEQARVIYEQLAKEFPDDQLAPMSLFNAAICHEEAGRFDHAISYYQQIQKQYPDSTDPILLSFRYAYCYENLKRWQDAIAILSSILAHPDVTPVQSIQAEARIAIATFSSGKEDKAKPLLRAALTRYEDLRDRRITVDNYFYAKICFTLGEYYFNRYREVELVGDMDLLEVNLENKGTLFILARAQYLKAIKTYDSEYLFASLHRIGEGYEHFYFSMLNAPLPEDLEPGEEKDYTKLLKEKIAPVLRKSMAAYRRNVEMGIKLRIESPWIDRSKKNLKHLETLQQEDS